MALTVYTSKDNLWREYVNPLRGLFGAPLGFRAAQNGSDFLGSSEVSGVSGVSTGDARCIAVDERTVKPYLGIHPPKKSSLMVS